MNAAVATSPPYVLCIPAELTEAGITRHHDPVTIRNQRGHPLLELIDVGTFGDGNAERALRYLQGQRKLWSPRSTRNRSA